MRWLSDESVERLRTAAETPDLTGTRYRLSRHIARGGMGSVWLAEDTALGRRVALKVLDVPDTAGELAARLLREARILARLEHPGIVPVHDVGTLTDGRVFYTMKFVEGQRLDRHLENVNSLPDRLRLFQRICEAVAFAHAHSVLHRDLKPQNVMVGPFGEVLVMDWGVAKVLRSPSEDHAETDIVSPPQRVAAEDASADTEHGTVLGTPGYMSPEQARGEVAQLDARADVYSLGAILRFVLTGRAPLESSTESVAAGAALTVSALGGKIPRPLAAIWAKAMATDPAGRYTSAEELAAEVGRFLDGLPVAAYPEGIFTRAARLVSRHRVAIVLVLAYLLTRIALFFWMRR